MSNLRIMVVGNFKWPWYQEACAAALERLGCHVERFGWTDDFFYWNKNQSEPLFHSIWHKLQYRFHTGPTVSNVQQRLLLRAKEFQPEIVWFYNVQLITSKTLKEMKAILNRAIFIQYANDNPFSPLARRQLWHHFLSSIQEFDIHFAYRLKNIEEYKHHGANFVHLLRSYFIPYYDYPIGEDSIPKRYISDVVFAGHYENDGRVEILEKICDSGYNLNLFGGGWNAAIPRLRLNSPLREKYPILPVTDCEYRYAICGAKVALCFLSTLNQDTYTRRNFQIPAMKTAMLSQYSDDLAHLFEEDKEIVFFRNSEQVIEKLKQMIEKESWRKSVADFGYSRVYNGGHDVDSRMKSFLESISIYKDLNNK